MAHIIPPSEHDELVEIRARYDALQREYIVMRDREQRAMTDERIQGERGRSAARRTAQERMLGLAQVHADAMVRESMAEIHQVLYVADDITKGPKSTTAQRDRLRVHVEMARNRIRHAQEREGAHEFLDRVHTEVARLRAYVMTTGRAIHDGTGRDVLNCDCTGCMLIIGMDLVDGEGA